MDWVDPDSNMSMRTRRPGTCGSTEEARCRRAWTNAREAQTHSRHESARALQIYTPLDYVSVNLRCRPAQTGSASTRVSRYQSCWPRSASRALTAFASRVAVHPRSVHGESTAGSTHADTSINRPVQTDSPSPIDACGPARIRGESTAGSQPVRGTSLPSEGDTPATASRAHEDSLSPLADSLPVHSDDPGRPVPRSETRRAAMVFRDGRSSNIACRTSSGQGRSGAASCMLGAVGTHNGEFAEHSRAHARDERAAAAPLQDRIPTSSTATGRGYAWVGDAALHSAVALRELYRYDGSRIRAPAVLCTRRVPLMDQWVSGTEREKVQTYEGVGAYSDCERRNTGAAGESSAVPAGAGGDDSVRGEGVFVQPVQVVAQGGCSCFSVYAIQFLNKCDLLQKKLTRGMRVVDFIPTYADRGWCRGEQVDMVRAGAGEGVGAGLHCDEEESRGEDPERRRKPSKRQRQLNSMSRPRYC
ncbi:hypothetical protein C8Q80DRAFT_1122105 [Daedaleopsis nitida]|nr:hypothetical protein C8Q80DRAFT_1122105 [Daedaleopsis nitida]